MSEHPNETLLREFYEAFSQRDGVAMGEAYLDDANFSDPVFTDLDGRGAAAMWTMLTERGADLKIEFSGIEADDDKGKAHWEAWYTFSATGKKVHNVIDAEFEFRDGKISKHTDRFDLYAWMKQALGVPGVLLGWSGLLQNKVRSQAQSQLERFREKRGL